MRKALLFLLFLGLIWIPQVKISICTDPGGSPTLGNPHSWVEDINWEQFWALFNLVSEWDLEYNQGSGWSSIKGDLTVLRNYPQLWLCKISLIFNASYHADYRLTFLIDRRVQNYSYQENRTRYVLGYQNYTLFFSWQDLLEIPGLQFSHGLIDYEGKPCFWFRLKRDDVPQGTYLELDPTFGYETTGASAGYPEEYIIGSLYECEYSGKITRIRVCVDDNDEGGEYSKTVQAGVYWENLSQVGLSNQYFLIHQQTNPKWYWLPCSTPIPVEAGVSYWLLFWADPDPDTVLQLFCDTDGATNQSLSLDMDEGPSTGSWPNSLIPDFYGNLKYSIYAEYYTAPSVGSFSSSQDPVYSNEWFNLNCTLEDQDGVSGLKNCTLEISENVTLGWDNSTGSPAWSEISDPYYYCDINSSACVEDVQNSTTVVLSWELKLATTYPHGTIVDVIQALVYDGSGYSGSSSESGLFLFEPEEAGEPGVPTGGGARRRTPLEELEIPTPLPYEVAPPEAQYGTIGLVAIMGGGTLYYITRGKSTQQLWRENTSPRSKRKGSTKPKPRKAHSKSSRSRRVHSKKQNRRPVRSKK